MESAVRVAGIVSMGLLIALVAFAYKVHSGSSNPFIPSPKYACAESLDVDADLFNNASLSQSAFHDWAHQNIIDSDVADFIDIVQDNDNVLQHTVANVMSGKEPTSNMALSASDTNKNTDCIMLNTSPALARIDSQAYQLLITTSSVWVREATSDDVESWNIAPGDISLRLPFENIAIPLL